MFLYVIFIYSLAHTKSHFSKQNLKGLQDRFYARKINNFVTASVSQLCSR